MALSKWERQNIFTSTVTWKSGSVAVNASGNLSYVDIIKSDGTYLVQNASGQHDGVGIYKYKASTSSNDPLGIYVINWSASFDYSGPWGTEKKFDKSAINVVYVNQD